MNLMRIRTPHSVIPSKYTVLKKDGALVLDQQGREIYRGGDRDAIQHAINNLTPNRTYKEKITLLGDFVLDGTVFIDSYTVIEIVGSVKLGNNVLKRMFVNRSNYGNVEIEIYGGVIDGNRTNNNVNGGDPDAVPRSDNISWAADEYDAIELYKCSKCSIHDIRIVNVRGQGIDVRHSNHVTIYNAFISNCRDECVLLHDSSYSVVSGCVLESARAGVYIELNDEKITGNIITDNIIRNNIYGIDIGTFPVDSVDDQKELTYECRKHIISNNVIYNNTSDGILLRPGKWVNIIGNQILWNGRHGIHSRGWTEGVKLIGNNVLDNAQYGIYIPGTTSQWVIIEGNFVGGNRAGQINVAGSRHIIRNNIAGPTGNPSCEFGSATIPAGSTSVIVSHNLGVVPRIALVTPNRNILVYVSAMTSSSITVSTATAPAEPVTIYYYLEA